MSLLTHIYSISNSNSISTSYSTSTSYSYSFYWALSGQYLGIIWKTHFPYCPNIKRTVKQTPYGPLF